MSSGCTGTHSIDQTRNNNQSHTQLLGTVCSTMAGIIGNISVVMSLGEKKALCTNFKYL